MTKEEIMLKDMKEEIARIELQIKSVAKLASEAKDDVTRIMRNGEINKYKAEIAFAEMIIRKYC